MHNIVAENISRGGIFNSPEPRKMNNRSSDNFEGNLYSWKCFIDISPCNLCEVNFFNYPREVNRIERFELSTVSLLYSLLFRSKTLGEWRNLLLLLKLSCSRIVIFKFIVNTSCQKGNFWANRPVCS